MRAFLGLSIVAFLSAASCEKAKELLNSSARKEAPAAASIPLTEIDAASYPSFVQPPGRLVVVVFGAEWCAVCKEMEPLLSQMAGEFSSSAVVAKIDFDRSKTFAKSENVSVLPDLRFYRDGKMVEQAWGAIEAGKLRETFQRHSQGIAPAPSGQNSGASGAPAAPAISPMKKDWLPPGVERR